MFKTSCFDIWQKEAAVGKIITLNKHLDKSLEGGFGLGFITELCGGPGVGKTQMCLQLCINVQFPEAVGGLEGEAYFIDTNHGFSPYRLKEIFEYTCQCLPQSIKSTDLIKNFTVNSVLNNVFYVYCPNYLELITEILNLRNLLKNHTKLKLIIVDSFTFIMRQMEDVELRTRRSYEILTEMQCIALEFNIAIVITNELTTRCLNGNWIIAPALGDLHTHKINQRLTLDRDSVMGYRVAIIEKSTLCKKVTVAYQIKTSGIRGI